MPVLKKFKGMVKTESNVKYAEDIKSLSDSDLEMMLSTSPGMTNVHLLAEKKRREDEKKKKE